MKFIPALVMLVSVAGCGGNPEKRPGSPPIAPAPPPPSNPAPRDPSPAPISEVEPSRIVVQHILIAFRGASRAADSVTRTQEEARTFALELLDQVRKGVDVTNLAMANSDDAGGGKYALVNHGVTADRGEIKRAMFIKPFTEVAFKLKVGECGFVEYDRNSAPFGWHVIKRLE